jgi:hypothetical protein
MTDFHIFLAGLFVSAMWLIFAGATINEFRKM